MTTLAGPWPSLNRQMPLEPGSVIILTGPSGHGVSMAALSIALHAAFEQEQPTAIVSKEMSAEGTLQRAVANRLRIDSTYFHLRDQLTDSDWERIEQLKAAEVPLVASHQPRDVLAVDEWLASHQAPPVRLLFVDGIEYLAPRLTSVADAATHVTPLLRGLAAKHGLTVVGTTHLSDERWERPMLDCGLDARVAESADAVLYLEQMGAGSLMAEVVKGHRVHRPALLAFEPQFSRVFEAQPLAGLERAGGGMDELRAMFGPDPLAVSTPWPALDALFTLRPHRKVGLVAQRGTHEATVGRLIAKRAAEDGPVLLFSGYPPAGAPGALVVDEEPAPTPEQVSAAVARMRSLGQSPRLVVIERYERMRLEERPEDVGRPDELEWCGKGRSWVEGASRSVWQGIRCPMVFTTVVDREPDLRGELVTWAGVDAPASILKDFCGDVVVLRRKDNETVQAQTVINHAISKWIVHDIPWVKPKGARRLVPSPAAPPARLEASRPAPRHGPGPAAPTTIAGAIRALETEYAGHRFRSRLEARWAVAFDALGVPWDYELERYQLPSGRYLPDFWLPRQGLFFEVKGTAPSSGYRRLLEELAVGTGYRVVLAVGSIPNPDRYEIGSEDEGSAFWMDSADVVDGSYVMWGHWQSWCQCPVCGAFDVQVDGRPDRMGCGCFAGRDAAEGGVSAAVLGAFRAARSARFEHGESGA